MSLNGAPSLSFVSAFERFLQLDDSSSASSLAGDSNSSAFQQELRQTIAYIKQCLDLRQREGVLSDNEPLSELQLHQLYAVCLEYYLVILVPKQSFHQHQSVDQEPPVDPRDGSRNARQQHAHEANLRRRVQALGESDLFASQFLDRAEQLRVLPSVKRKEQYERIEKQQFALPRDEKIQRFRFQCEIEKKLQVVQSRRAKMTRGSATKSAANEQQALEQQENTDEDASEVEREQLLLFIQLAVIKAMDEQNSVLQEKSMLEKMLQMNEAAPSQGLFSDKHRAPPPPPGQGITVTHINPAMEMRRETIRAGVFQPGHRMPTMSLEEFGDMQLEEAKERQRREKEAPQPIRRIEQLEEDGEEDDHDLVDQATYRDREWDDWKDANPRGIGNKKGSQF